MESQTMKHSHSILAQLVLPMQANPAGNVHGGENYENDGQCGRGCGTETRPHKCCNRTS